MYLCRVSNGLGRTIRPGEKRPTAIMVRRVGFPLFLKFKAWSMDLVKCRFDGPQTGRLGELQTSRPNRPGVSAIGLETTFSVGGRVVNER